jgi:hypothetical protein
MESESLTYGAAPLAEAKPATAAEIAAPTEPTPLVNEDPKSDFPAAQSQSQIATDAKNDVAAVKSQAITAAKEEVDTAASAIDKLLSTAAGDAPQVLTDAESATVPLILSKIPGSLGSEVGAFVQVALSATAPVVETALSAGVAKGLAYAQAEIAALQHHLDELL